ncbi:MAG: hypothetical protein Q8N26_13085 [Myxococcales bacterium]|nr:hypothetical protein [Myxococcales bacterium]
MLALVAMVLCAPSGPTWALFPEGTTELREDIQNNRKGTRRRVTTRVTRTGSRVSVSIESTEAGEKLGNATTTSVSTEASSLTDPATSPEGKVFDFRCVKKTGRVHSPDMTFVPPTIKQECDGGFVGVRSKRPKNAPLLVCRVDHQNADTPVLTFAPGKVLERVYEDNDCTLAEGLRFADAALDSGTKQREGVRK